MRNEDEWTDSEARLQASSFAFCAADRRPGNGGIQYSATGLANILTKL
jgi:hypothetical protein